MLTACKDWILSWLRRETRPSFELFPDLIPEMQLEVAAHCDSRTLRALASACPRLRQRIGRVPALWDRIKLPDAYRDMLANIPRFNWLPQEEIVYEWARALDRVGLLYSLPVGKPLDGPWVFHLSFTHGIVRLSLQHGSGIPRFWWRVELLYKHLGQREWRSVGPDGCYPFLEAALGHHPAVLPLLRAPKPVVKALACDCYYC